MKIKHYNRLSHQQGYLVFIAVILIVVIGFIGLAVAEMFYSSTRSTSDYLQAAKALFLAESGIEQATHEILTSTVANRSACSGLSINNSIGAGAYSVTTSGPFYVSSPSTVSGALTATATTIPVVSTTGYQSAGRLMIDSELINYSGISGNNFIGVTRGVDGSTATTHASGVSVGQYQCGLSSAGGVTSLTAPTIPNDPFGKRMLLDNIQLQEAWAMGNAASSKYTLISWNLPTEVTWTNESTAISGSNSLTGINMISTVDGWAVGAAGKFLHWNGNTWAVTTVSPAVTYYGVYCNSSHDCHAVGAKSGSKPSMVHWNGSTWSQISPGGSTGNNTLQSVHCDSSSDCWAVGDNTAGKDFYQWNGSTWTGVSESSLSGYTFNGVYCNSSTDCWAVGANATFARKSGASWANFTTGLPAAQYNSVFCNNSSDCWAAGNSNGGKDLLVHWNGSVWSRDASNPSPIGNLLSVSCANSNDCWSVGQSTSGTNSPIFVHWDGTSWTQFSPSGMPSNTPLNSVSIVGPGSNPHSAWSENYP